MFVLALAVCLVAVMGSASAARTQGSSGTFLGLPAWSPDGKHVAWVAGPPNASGTVWVAKASGRGAYPLHQFGTRVVGDGVGQIEWLSPKSLLVDAQWSERVRLFRLSLSGKVTLISPLTDLSFSTDRARHLLATTSYTSDCGYDNCPGRIHILHLASGKVTQAGSRGALNLFPALSPDGKRIVYDPAFCNGDCGNPEGIWLASAAGTGTPRQVAPVGEYPIWSPNGRLLAYEVDPPDGNALGLEVQQPGGQPRTVVPSGEEGGFVFSPDSRSLAYDYHPNNGSDLQELQVVNLRTGRVYQQSPPGPAIVSAQAWSPNGKQLLAVVRPGGLADCQSLYKVTIQPRRWKLFRSCG